MQEIKNELYKKRLINSYFTFISCVLITHHLLALKSLDGEGKGAGAGVVGWL